MAGKGKGKGKAQNKGKGKGKKSNTTKQVVASKNLSKAIRAEMGTLAEAKIQRMLYSKQDNTGIAPYNGVNWSLDNGVFALSPVQNRIQIAQGTGEGERIGAKIRTKRSYVSGIMWASPYDVTYNPIPRPLEVMVLIYKIIGGGNTIQSNLANLYQLGNTPAGPNTNLSDTVLPINSDLYRVYYRRIFKVGAADNSGTGTQVAYQTYANNDYKRNQRFFIDITKWLDKVIKYDGTSTTANNSMLYMAIMPINSDGSQPATGNSLRPLSLSMCQVYEYTDM